LTPIEIEILPNKERIIVMSELAEVFTPEEINKHIAIKVEDIHTTT